MEGRPAGIAASGERLNWMLHGEGEQTPALASKIACTSVPLPLAFGAVTTSVWLPVTVTVDITLLFARSGSDSLPTAEASACIVPPMVAVVLIATLAFAEFASVPNEQLMVDVPLQVPVLGVIVPAV